MKTSSVSIIKNKVKMIIFAIFDSFKSKINSNVIIVNKIKVKLNNYLKYNFVIMNLNRSVRLIALKMKNTWVSYSIIINDRLIMEKTMIHCVIN